MIHMTEEQLVEYTERVVKTALEKTAPKRDALRSVLLEKGEALFLHVKKLDEEKYERRWITTKTDDYIIIEAIANIDYHSIGGLRAWIKNCQSAIKRLEAARERTRKKVEQTRLQSHRRLDRKEERHLADGHKCPRKKNACSEHLSEIAIARLVADAPPLSMRQVTALRRIFSA